MNIIPKGWRRLSGRDIVRKDDVEWAKVLNISFISSDGRILAIPTKQVGNQMCTEEMRNYGNNIYRKLKNAPPEQTSS